MPKESLKASLLELQAALADAEFKDPIDRERMQALIAKIEVEANAPEPFQGTENLASGLEESIGRLELEHPLASQVLQRILQLSRNLGGGGI